MFSKSIINQFVYLFSNFKLFSNGLFVESRNPCYWRLRWPL